MRTPAGNECPYFFGDYYRGRNQEECRLLGPNPKQNGWTPNLCKTCPVPGIVLANACPNMALTGTIQKTLFGLFRGVKVSAFCSLSQSEVSEPHIGCGQCHPLPPEFNARKP